jgi:hypothetical protein
MKLNLEYGTNIRNGYANVSAWPPQELPKDLPDETSIAVGQAGNLDAVVPDGESEEILFNPVFNLISPAGILPLLQHWHKKLKDGGLLKLYFIDIRLISRFIYNGQLPLQEIHNLIMGPSKQHESVIDTDVMKNALSACGYKINAISHQDFFVSVEASK